MITFIETIQFTKIDCGCCGASYAINERFRAKCEEDGKHWYCPYCKVRWGYENNNENARLRKSLETKERELREAKCETLRQQNLREIEAKAKERAEKKLRRVNKGVCPCCNRSFSNLHRHMETKHSVKSVLA